MTSVYFDHEENPVVLLANDDPTFEILTWCSDTEGKVPAQVHFVIKPTSEVKILYRFTGPRTLDGLIEALQMHRRDVWG